MADPQKLKSADAARGGVVHGRTAPAEGTHFVACPTCGEWLDIRDFAELIRHAETEHAPATIQ